MRFLQAALLFLWTLIPVAPVLAQGEDENPVPPAPENLILDEARLFARQPERLQAIATALAALEEKHNGYRLYFAIYDSLIGSSPEDRAEALQKKWLGEQPGAVLVLESDSFRWAYGQAPPLKQEAEPGNIVERERPTGLSELDKQNIHRNLEQALLPLVNKDRQAFAETLGPGVAREISALLDQRAAVPAGGRSRMVLLSIGLLAVVGLVALLVVAALKRVEARSRERYVFPKVTVGIRLGAPYGGGKVGTREFGRK